jgi:hypothetical protein
MRRSALSVCLGLLVLAALAALPGAGLVSEADGLGRRSSGFRGVTFRTGRCQALSGVGVIAWRNTIEEVNVCVPRIGPCGVHTIGGRRTPQPDVDALYVEMCIDAGTKLAGRFPDSVQRVGSQRIVAAQVELDARGRAGDLTVMFYGGDHVRVPLDIRETPKCAKPCPAALHAAPPTGPGSGSKAPAGHAPHIAVAGHLVPGERKPHGPFGLHRFRIRNNHPRKRVRKATAHTAEEKAADAPLGTSPLEVRNVEPLTGPIENPVEGEEYARVVHVTICLEGGETLQASVTANDDREASLFQLVEVTVGEQFDGASTLTVSAAVLHDLSGYTAAPETNAAITCARALETVRVDNGRLPNQPVTVRVLAGAASIPLTGGNPFPTPGGQTKLNYTYNDDEYQQLTIRVCTNVPMKNLNFPLVAAADRRIRSVLVQVAGNGDTTVTAELDDGSSLAAGAPTPANPCP